jgi:hypothetical protein
MLNRFPDGKVVVEGHTDSTGPAEYNIGLSTRRAEAAKAYLVGEAGIPAERFVLRSYGESMPVARNDAAEGRKRNRRVELKGEISKTVNAERGETYRTDPFVGINHSAVEVDSQGCFTTRVSGGPGRIEVEIRNADGRSIHATVALPSP